MSASIGASLSVPLKVSPGVMPLEAAAAEPVAEPEAVEVPVVLAADMVADPAELAVVDALAARLLAAELVLAAVLALADDVGAAELLDASELLAAGELVAAEVLAGAALDEAAEPELELAVFEPLAHAATTVLAAAIAESRRNAVRLSLSVLINSRLLV